jgi:hypothetical protein
MGKTTGMDQFIAKGINHKAQPGASLSMPLARH